MLSLPPLNLRQAVCILLATWTEIVFAAPFDELTPNSTPPPAATSQGEDSTEQKSVSIDVARDRAKLMHEVYLATLNVMHDRYFHADRAIVPARAMQDVFREIEYKTSSKANWISVNLKAMSIDHEPKTKFEKRAAKEISKGVTGVESIEQGVYRRAGAIPMATGCIGCHAGFSRQPSKTPRFAGLVISIPIESPSGDQ